MMWHNSASLRCRDLERLYEESRPLGFRRSHPEQPVRSIQPLRSRSGSARRFHPLRQRHQPARQRVGQARAQRHRRRRVRRAVRRRVRGTRPPRAGRCSAGPAVRRGSPGDGRPARSGQGRRLQGCVPHQQCDGRRSAAPSGPPRSAPSWPASTRSWRAARSAAASPSRASTRSPANCSMCSPTSACSSTTSASTSSPPPRWA